MSSNIQELEINEDLKKCGVTRFAKEYSASILIVCKQKPIIFKIQKERLFATLQNFKDNCRGKLDQKIQETIIMILSSGEYYPTILSNGNVATYNSSEEETTSSTIFSTKENDHEEAEDEKNTPEHNEERQIAGL